jgi:hypothetical protein
MGYRHVDCAADYQNEGEVGEALAAVMADGTVRREGASNCAACSLGWERSQSSWSPVSGCHMDGSAVTSWPLADVAAASTACTPLRSAELWVTSKLQNTDHEPQRVQEACR